MSFALINANMQRRMHKGSGSPRFKVYRDVQVLCEFPVYVWCLCNFGIYEMFKLQVCFFSLGGGKGEGEEGRLI